MRWLRLIPLSLIIFTLSACAANRSFYESTSLGFAPATAPMTGAAPGMWAPAMEEMAWDAPMPTGFADHMVERIQRRIKTGSMTMESEDIEAAAARFESLTAEFGGWVESRSIGGGIHKFADLTLRVSAELYEDFVIAAHEIGRVRHFNDNVIDVTAEYYDAQARLNINIAEESRLLEFIENSVDLEDIIRLEARLSEVRLEIERHEANVRRIDRAVSFSTLHVHLTERGAPTIRPLGANLGTRMGDGFTSSLDGIVRFTADTMVFFAYISVPAGIVGACFLTGMLVYKSHRKLREPAEAE
ncbi:MAG: DUF4349 domain-containing protein [Defluviitaleaceae bacterium]|nr:DUF4349 domain-containing protein [Defluviitaleaceae bacterium]